jgi:Novel STAND NTPase 1
VSSATEASVIQKVGDLSGTMTGIQTTGDVHVENLLQLQITSFSSEPSIKEIPLDTNPYVSLYPYTARNAPLFRGRDSEIKTVVDILRSQSVLVLYGRAGVGKTSLLAAGVVPALGAEATNFAIQIQDYKDPAAMILAALAEADKSLGLDSHEHNNLPILLERIIAKRGSVVLILDQFELLFEPTIEPKRRIELIEDVAAAINAHAARLRVIISVRGDSLEKLGELEQSFEKLFQGAFQLHPMSRQQAQQAIEVPKLVEYEPDLVETQLLPDLDALTEDDPGYIHPQYLQIVCSELYQKTNSEHRVKYVTSKVYARDLKGADGIMASFLRRMIQQHVKEKQQDFACQLLSVMASPGAVHWMKASEFDLKRLRETQAEAILDDLVRAKLLIRNDDGGKTYSLVSQFVAREFRRISGTGEQVEQRYNAEDELERIWRAWLALERYASLDQLQYLAESGGHLRPRSVKTLLLLRSATELDADTSIWLGRFRGDGARATESLHEGKRLIEQLESNGNAKGSQISTATLLNAKRLLGFAESELTDGPSLADASSCGPVAKSAVTATSSAARQTCALALAAAGADFATSRLKAALRDIVKGSGRRVARRSELFGTLADADPNIARLNSELPLLQRTLIWRWRARRRVSRDGRRLAWLTLGGALGAGIGVGLWRAISAVPVLLSPGQEFGIYFFFAGTLGGAAAYGTALGETLDFRRAATASKSWRSPLIGIVLGSCFFGFTHFVLAILNGLPVQSGASYIVVLMGFVLGLGLSVSVILQVSFSHAAARVIRLIASLVIAAGTFIFVSEFFLRMREEKSDELETLITRGVSYFEFVIGIPQGSRPPWWLDLIKPLSLKAHAITTVHTAIIGMSMFAGMLVGLKWAKRRHNKKRR